MSKDPVKLRVPTEREQRMIRASAIGIAARAGLTHEQAREEWEKFTARHRSEEGWPEAFAKHCEAARGCA
jgi:hypothetical protein